MPATLSTTKKDLEAALPDMSKTLHLKGPADTVQVHRDAYGIPHVRARSTRDAFFGQGFVTAQDRLWHMDQDRHWAYGRWAEYAGTVAIDQDVLMRRFQIHPSVESDYAAVNPETRAMFDAYAAGVNAFIQSTGSLPVEYALLEAEPEAWEPWDCIAVFKARHILMGLFESKLWKARLVNTLGPEKAASILPGYREGHLLIAPPGAEYLGHVSEGLAHLRAGAEVTVWLGDVDGGSNNWALSGNRTASGRPLLAGDPHRVLDTPNVYYQNHIACPEFDAIGLSFPGFPGFPHFGHNAHVAWCVTHAQADYQDLYVERFDLDSPTQYEFKGEWKQADVRHEVIEVKGSDSIEVDVTVTHHGPVIAGEPTTGYAAAFKYTSTSGPNKGPECLPRMLRARSADELDESMRDWVEPSHNFVFGDVHGDIGYLNRGKLPIRSMANAWLPVPGWTGEHEWEGFVPFEELVRSRNPERGYIVTANNRIVDDSYQHYIGIEFSPEFRARRIAERIQQLNDATVEDMASVHGDEVSMPAQAFVRLLSNVQPLDDLSADARQRLLAWDGTMDRDAVEPSIYSAFRLKLNRRLLEHALGPLTEEAVTGLDRGAPFHRVRLEAEFVEMAKEDDTSLLPPGTDWSSLMAQALVDGVAYLKDRLGDDVSSWKWGGIHVTRSRHALSESFPEMAEVLDPPSMPVGGDGDTPHAMGYRPSEPFTVTGTSIARYVFDISDWDNSRWIIPLGASGHPGSPHYADQAPIWGDVRLIPMLYDWDRIAAEAETHQELRPETGFGVLTDPLG